jgi:hypothetical protein
MTQQQDMGDQELLSAYLDNQLEETERLSLEQRLSVEPTLQTELEELRAVVQMCWQLEPVPLPRSFTLDIPTLQRKRPWWRGGWVWTGAGVLATLLFAFVLSSLFGTTSSSMPQQVAQATSTVHEEQAMASEAPSSTTIALAPSVPQVAQAPANRMEASASAYGVPAWTQTTTLPAPYMTPVPSVETRSFITRPSQVNPTASAADAAAIAPHEAEASIETHDGIAEEEAEDSAKDTLQSGAAYPGDTTQDELDQPAAVAPSETSSPIEQAQGQEAKSQWLLLTGLTVVVVMVPIVLAVVAFLRRRTAQ